MKLVQSYEQQEITAIRTSNESDLFSRKRFHRIPLYFKIYAFFEASDEIDSSCKVEKATNIYEQNPVCNGVYKVSELSGILQSDYNESLLGYDNVGFEMKERH